MLIANNSLASPWFQETLFITHVPVAQVQIDEAQSEFENPQDTSSESEDTQTMPTNSDTQNQPQNSNNGTEQTADRQQSESAGPYDMEAIKAFNRALYGS